MWEDLTPGIVSNVHIGILRVNRTTIFVVCAWWDHYMLWSRVKMLQRQERRGVDSGLRSREPKCGGFGETELTNLGSIRGCSQTSWWSWTRACLSGSSARGINQSTDRRRKRIVSASWRKI